MTHWLAALLLWGAGIWAVLSACALGVLLFRAARDWYWRRRFTRAIQRKYPADVRPLIYLIRKRHPMPDASDYEVETFVREVLVEGFDKIEKGRMH